MCKNNDKNVQNTDNGKLSKDVKNKKYELKLKIYFGINILLFILWMLLVFNFSASNADDSTVTSGNLIRAVIKAIYQNIDTEKLEQMVTTLQPYVRKLAHFAIYFIGGIIISNLYFVIAKLFKSLNMRKKYIKYYTLVTGYIYATFDEIHQYFVPGRSCEVRDVCIDLSGVAVGMVMYVLMWRLYYKYIKRKIT